MTKVTKNLPSFADPPLIEVSLSVQFEELKNLQAAQIGLLWANYYRDNYPHTEQHPPIAPAYEQFGDQRKGVIKIEVAESIPNPRCWFINNEGTELIQIQNDRIVHNWRKTTPDDGYPRYEAIRDKYKSILDIFFKFINDEKIGDIKVNQCEVTYTNHIISSNEENTHLDTSKIFSNWNSEYSDSFLWSPENARFSTQHVIENEANNPIGRLHINVQSALLKINNMPIYVMTLTSRGAPNSNDQSGVFDFLDYGREIIVKAFKSMTTSNMHKLWKLKDNADE